MDTYTADDLRMQQGVDGAATAFAWDWATGVPELLTDGAKRYLVGHDTLGWADAAGWTYAVPDALGSVSLGRDRQAVDGAGDLVDAREWTPYGVGGSRRRASGAGLYGGVVGCGGGLAVPAGAEQVVDTPELHRDFM